jgi:hypothetical protein
MLALLMRTCDPLRLSGCHRNRALWECATDVGLRDYLSVLVAHACNSFF